MTSETSESNKNGRRQTTSMGKKGADRRSGEEQKRRPELEKRVPTLNSNWWCGGIATYTSKDPNPHCEQTPPNPMFQIAHYNHHRGPKMKTQKQLKTAPLKPAKTQQHQENIQI
ncbi:hypothetical protein QL285_074011 [Trifolium repens]|nr:hypothetical protein QL285_074011 [Trifolium repens]